MKTKDLIEQLQKADPSGEIECCVGNADIHCVIRYPAYWDGLLQVFDRDPKYAGYFNIRGAKRTGEGEKLQIQAISIHELIEDDPEFPVEYPEGADWYRASDEKVRAEAHAEEIENKNAKTPARTEGAQPPEGGDEGENAKEETC